MKLQSTETAHVTLTLSASVLEQFRNKLVEDGVVSKTTGKPDVAAGIRQLIQLYLANNGT